MLMVTTDASTRGWGAVCKGIPTSGLWSEPQSRWHKNRLELEEVLSSKGFSAAAGTAACTDSHRQHVCGFLHKSPRRRTLQGSVRTGSGSPAMGGPSFSLHLSSVHHRSPEPWGGHAFEERGSPRRVDIASRVGLDDLDSSGGGSVHHKRECALPAVLFPSPLPAGRGRSDIALASSQAVCVSSDQDTATDVIP